MTLLADPEDDVAPVVAPMTAMASLRDLLDCCVPTETDEMHYVPGGTGEPNRISLRV